ncbi:MAG: hypothetical protein HKN03_17575, partial [Acidimicrobiales bacterium]|nr:hypothetical protein [Acidimicrobiales bacterium]
MKLRSILAIFAALALVAGACGGDDGESAPEGFRIGIVAPSASNDLAFTQSIVDAANALSGDPEILITDGTF